MTYQFHKTSLSPTEQNAQNVRTFQLGQPLEVKDVFEFAQGHMTLGLCENVRKKLSKASRIIDRHLAEKRRLYGVTTGYGPLATSYISPDQSETLQKNLIYHLSSGVGTPYSVAETRAILLSRLSSLSQGFSGVSPDLLDKIIEMVEAGFVPSIPEQGTVGASGDLTPLAHMALAIMGEGEAFLHGVKMPSQKALSTIGLAPIKFGRKDALALVNGTSAMTGLAAMNGARANQAFHLALRLGALNAELMFAKTEAFLDTFSHARPHQGQAYAQGMLSKLLADSQLTEHWTGEQPIMNEFEAALQTDQNIPQDPYTVRCLPQEFGAAFDVLTFHNNIVETELNSATDNPLVDSDTGVAVQGGNFYGQHVAYASDSLILPIIKTAIHAERCIARICDPKRNLGLPAFLQPTDIGLRSGFMGAQVTASALVAEMRTKAIPASIQSISTNNDNQDVVTMGTIAARNARNLMDQLYFVLAIEAIVLAQAGELRGEQLLSTESKRLVRIIREKVDFLDADRPLSNDIDVLAGELQTKDWINLR